MLYLPSLLGFYIEIKTFSCAADKTQIMQNFIDSIQKKSH